MYIRTRQEALDALVEVVSLPDRTSQIIRVTVLIALCLDPDPRNFLMDCQAGLIEEGLEFMRRRRQELLTSMQQEGGFEPILIVDVEQDALLADVGTAMDTLRVVEIVKEVFPNIALRHEEWELGRAILADEALVRESLVAAVRLRGHEEQIEEIEMSIESRLEAHRPEWHASAPRLLEICTREIEKGTIGDGTKSPADNPRTLYNVVALSDTHSQTILDLGSSGSDASDYLLEIRKRIHMLHEVDLRSTK